MKEPTKTKRFPCGCWEKTKYLGTRQTTPEPPTGGGRIPYWYAAHLCEQHQKEENEAVKEREQRNLKEAQNNAETLICYHCGKHIGYVSSRDLCGYFMCDKCYKMKS
jgi:hypothetical protein